MKRGTHMPYLRMTAAACMALAALSLPKAAFGQEMYRGAPIITVLPKDAIAAIDRPEFVGIAEADKVMQADELVISMRDGGNARAYSTWLLNHHEIVNDVVDAVPLAITW